MFLDGPDDSGFSTLDGSMMSCFRMALGDSDYTVFATKNSGLATTLYVMYQVLAAVLLLNLLIAAMSNSYQSVQDDAINEWRLEWAANIVRIEQSLTPAARQHANGNLEKPTELAVAGDEVETDDESPNSELANKIALEVIRLLAEKGGGCTAVQ